MGAISPLVTLKCIGRETPGRPTENKNKNNPGQVLKTPACIERIQHKLLECGVCVCPRLRIREKKLT